MSLTGSFLASFFLCLSLIRDLKCCLFLASRLHQLCAGQAELWQILQENNELLTEFCSVLTQLPPAGTEGRPTPENP